jgi:tetratricopeptide (TPR) repeat protein/predicted Ser/Thr protein kinase
MTSITHADSLQGIEPARDEPAAPFEVDRGARVDRYVVLDKLGAGGMGVVYAAYDPELDRKVALKLLRTNDVTARARLMREAKAVARLHHPNVVSIHDVGTVGGRVYLAMQLIEGSTLRRWLEAETRPVYRVLEVLRGAGRGLSAAHRAGLVHRDFKPENVLVDRRGHPTVLDFGIARRAGGDDVEELDPTREASGSGAEVSGPLTRADSIMGTPAYMAPEQHLKEPADARADQFAFCVVAWEALWGRRPFSGETAGEIARAVTEGRPPDPPRRPGVPARVRRALLRGLSRRPEDRHPSMSELLAALAADPRGGRRRAIALAGLATAAGAGVFAATREVAPPSDPCAGAEARFEGVWDPPRRTAIEDAFEAADVPYAEQALDTVARELDAWRGAWIAAHEDACRATHFRHEQSPEMLDLRMACLSRRLADVQALTAVLAQADAGVVRNAVTAVKGLGRIDACADIEALASRARPPEDPRVRARVAELRERLSEARAQELAGRWDQALQAAGDVATQAQRLGYLPLAAEASERLGAAAAGAGDWERASRHLLEAIWAAEESRAEETAADAWLRLVWVDGVERVEPEKGRTWAAFARAAVRRLGRDELREATLNHNLGGVHYRQGDLDQALAHYQAALVVQQRMLGPEDPAVARTLNHIGNVLIEQGRLDEAVDHCRRSLELRRGVLGERHPLVAASLNNIAEIRYRQGRLGDARDAVDQALSITQGTDGPEELVASTLAGRIALAQRRPEEAVAGFRRAVALREAASGSDGPQLAADLRELGDALAAAGRADEAAAARARAQALGG